MIDCPICYQKNNCDILKTYKKFNVVRCSNCQSIYSNFGSYDDVSIESEMIGADSINKLNILDLPRFFLNRYSSKAVADFDIYYLQRHIDFSSINTALDIGSKYGFLVKNLLDVGIDAKGIEATHHPYTVAEKNITYGYFDENYDEDKLYDLITMGDILYINPDGHKMLKNAMRMLSKGGFLYITSFNPNSKIIHDVIERHGIGPILYLSEKGIQKICLENNYAIVDITYSTPKVFVIKINLMNKLRAGITLIKYLLKMDRGFDENSNGVRSYILLKKQ